MKKNQTELCRVSECQNAVNNTYEKWQLDLCILHLAEFMKWFAKNEKIIAIFDKFCEKWESLKNSNDDKTKKKIKQKIAELEIYFENQRKTAIKFEKGEKIMTNWSTIEELKTKLIECLKEDIESEKIKDNFSENQYLIEQLDIHADQALANYEGQYQVIVHYGYWDPRDNINSIAHILGSSIEKLKTEIWEELENKLLNQKQENEFEL